MNQITRLIVADNSSHARRGLCAILATQPGLHIVGEASQGAEAIAIVESQHPNVALLDVRMPVMDGIEAACAIKKRWPQVRVILISLYSDYEKEALASGADAFLVKGCSTDELISTILGTTSTESITAKKA